MKPSKAACFVAVALSLFVGCTNWRILKHVPVTEDQLDILGYTLPSTNSPFVEYDRAIVEAVQQSWYHLIKKNELSDIPKIKYPVIYVSCLLDENGNVHDVSVQSPRGHTRWGELCVKAIMDASPFQPLPETLGILYSNEWRKVNFTFYY